MELIFASNNKHKLEEVSQALCGVCRIIPLSEAGFIGEIPEEETTIEGNALQKARYIYHHFHKSCFADDTGLEVDALGGQPGVYSARYAGKDCSFDDNMNKLLSQLEGIANRRARFCTVISLILDGREYLFQGRVDGTILTHRQGEEGFGYDPIFVPQDADFTFAQMSLGEKNSISHRGRALVQLAIFLQTYLDTGGRNKHL
jgi:XTP/dITP diphosphohydrolase